MNQSAVYTDFTGLSELRGRVRDNPAGSLREVAQQFEAIFMQMMLKSMRDATLGEGLFDSDQSAMYRDLFDRQVTLSMASRGGLGLSDAIVQQLRRYLPQEAGATGAFPEAGLGVYRREALASHRQAEHGPAAQPASPGEAPEPEVAAGARDLFADPLGFVRGVWRHAQQAARELGLAPQALVAQAALETGWGQHVLARPDGASSHNLFGIKADGRWSGERVQARTVEFRDGVLRREHAQFRAYPSVAASFNDYVAFIKSNPRYRAVLEAGADAAAFGRALQQAGYATDPEYASKIKRIAEGDDLRQALEGLNI